MAYSKEQIESMATELINAGAEENDVRDFITSATSESFPEEAKQLAASPADTSPGTVDQGDFSKTSYFPNINNRQLNVSTIDPLEGAKGFVEHVAESGVEGGSAAVGQALGAPLAPATFGASIPVGGFIGGVGGNIAVQSRRILSGEQKTFSMGDMLAAGVGGAIPGGQGKGAVKLAVEGGMNAVGNVAAGAVRTGIDEKRWPTKEEIAANAAGGILGTAAGRFVDTGKGARELAGKIERNSPEVEVTKLARDAGYVLPPARTNPNITNSIGEYLSGPLGKSFSLKNQEVTDDLGRNYIGLPENKALSEANMAAEVFKAQAPYREIASLSPQAAANLDGFMQARADSRDIWKAYDNNPTPELKKAGNEQDALADLFRDEIELEAMEVRPELKKEFEAARVQLAKLHMVEQALGSDGHLDARAFSRAYDNGALLSDDAVTIAKAYETFKPVMRNKRDLAGGGSGKFPLIDKAARGIMATETYQNNLAIPSYGNPRPDLSANAARLSSMRFTQEDPETQAAKKNGAALYFLKRQQGG